MNAADPPSTRIEVLYVEGCPNLKRLLAVLDAVLASSDSAALVTLREVRSDDEALALRFIGSPTLRVNGRDVEPAAEACNHYGLGCRIYGAAVTQGASS